MLKLVMMMTLSMTNIITLFQQLNIIFNLVCCRYPPMILGNELISQVLMMHLNKLCPRVIFCVFNATIVLSKAFVVKVDTIKYYRMSKARTQNDSFDYQGQMASWFAGANLS